MMPYAGSMMVAVRRAIACSACVLALGAPIAAAGAQGGPPATGASETRRGSRAIERQLQERVMRIMKERLSLNDEQLKQLNEVTQQFEQQRRSVRGEDYRLRMALRSQLMAGDSASQDRVAELLERMPRARFLALQDEIRRNMEEIRNRRTDSGGRTGAPPHGSRPPQQL
jgi:hypothetical protein